MKPMSTETTLPEVSVPVNVSHSSLTLHRKCPQAWYYRYELNLDRLQTAPAVELEFGMWWHALLAADSLTRGREHDSLKKLPARVKTVTGGPTFDPKTVTVADVIEDSAQWWKSLTSESKDVWIEKLGEEAQPRLRNLFERFVEMWREDRTNERPLAVEMGWGRPLPRLSAEAPNLILVGYVDEIYLDVERNIIVVRDHKTGKSLSTQSAADDMMDSQLQLYSWGVAPKVQEWGLGPIQATAYDRARSAKGSQPTLTAGGSLSKSTSDYDLQTYLDFAKGPDGEGVPWGEPDSYFVSGPRKGQPKFGIYTAEQSVIDRLSDPASKSAWFQRTLVPLNKNIIRAHLRAAVDAALDIERTKERTAATREASRNLTSSSCRWCDYQALCRAQMVGGPDGDYEPEDYGLQVGRL